MVLTKMATTKWPSSLQLDPTCLYAFSEDPALIVRDTTCPTDKFAFKPEGFWYSAGADWLEWCRDNHCERFLHPYLYEIQLDYSDVLCLRDPAALLDFTRQYNTFDLSWLNIQIDWVKLWQEYAGIEIAPYLQECRLEPATHWYYSWDCASGCVWRADVVKEVRRL